jgi:hypothetical protein
MAGSLGMGYSFASHFSATPAAPAFEAYRRTFVPSAAFERPHAILGVTVICCASPIPGKGKRLAGESSANNIG